MPGGVGERRLVPPVHRDAIDVEFPPPLSGVDQKLPVRRPSVQVRRAQLRDPPRCPASHRYRIYDRGVVILRALLADRERSPVEGQDVIIVVAGGEPGVQGDGSPIGEVEAIQQALAVVDQDRKSTRLNSSHSQISYAVFCLKKKKKNKKSRVDSICTL